MNRPIVLSAAAALLIAGAVAAHSTKPVRQAPTAPVNPVVDAGTRAAARDSDIVLFERRLVEDPASAADRSRLATLYLRRARETGNFVDVERATREARQSLRLREGHNQATYGILASALLAQHDFVGALAAARALAADAPESAANQSLLGEVLLELGQYDQAATVFTLAEREPATLGTAPRLARWYELTGRMDRARAMARYALRLSAARDDLTPEQHAWYLMRTGDLEAKHGAASVADSLYQAGLVVNPDDYRLLSARARLAASQGRWRDVVSLGESAISTQLEPGTLGLLREAWLALGDSAQAESYAHAMTASALTQPGPIHRAWGLHLVDHGERLDEVLSRVRREQRTREDVYGYDLEAWTLHAMGRDAEAWRAAERAVSQQTEDALLWYHAGVIAAATQRDQLARDYLGRALQLNPSFSVRGVAHAKALLSGLPAAASSGKSG
ncbi:MAG: hypothetical protein ABIZ91_02015 [Gemmatimonadaceae bacterium]